MGVCRDCGKHVFGGVHHSFEPDERVFIGLPVKRKVFLCHKCSEGNTENTKSETDLKKALEDKGLCGENRGWEGRCRNRLPCDRCSE